MHVKRERVSASDEESRGGTCKTMTKKMPVRRSVLYITRFVWLKGELRNIK